MSDPADDDAARADAAMSQEGAAATPGSSENAVPLVTEAMMRAISAMALSRNPGADVAGNYEIIERIMLHLPRRDLLLSWLVNKAFKSVFLRSEPVKKKLRMHLPKPGDSVYVNTLSTGPFDTVRLQWRYDELSLCICGFDMTRVRRSNKDSPSSASWRLMPLCPSMEGYEHFVAPLVGRGNARELWLRQDTCSLPGFITMGQLSDALVGYGERNNVEDKEFLVQFAVAGSNESQSSVEDQASTTSWDELPFLETW